MRVSCRRTFKSLLMLPIIALSSFAGAASEKLDVNNCYTEDLGGPRYCQIVPGDPEVYSTDWFKSEWDKYGTNIKATGRLIKVFSDGKIDKDEMATLLNVVGTFTGAGPIGTMLGIGGKKPYDFDAAFAKLLKDVTYVVQDSEANMKDAMNFIAVQQDSARLDGLSYDMRYWSGKNDINVKLADNSFLANMIENANNLFATRFADYNTHRSIDRLHGSVLLARIRMNLMADGFRVSDFGGYPESESSMLYGDLSASQQLKLQNWMNANYYDEYNQISYFNESEFELFKVEFEKFTINTILTESRAVAEDIHKLLQYYDTNESYLEEIEERFNPIDPQGAPTGNNPTINNILHIGSKEGYKAAEYIEIAKQLPSLYCSESKLYYESEGNAVGHFKSYNKNYLYEVNGAEHNIRLINVICMASTQDPFTGEWQPYGQSVINKYSDAFGNLFDSYDDAITWHKKLELERLILNVYQPVKKDIQQMWSELGMTLAMDNYDDFNWHVPNSDAMLDNIRKDVDVSYVWHNYQYVGERQLSNEVLSSDLLPGHIEVFVIPPSVKSVTVQLDNLDAINKAKIKEISCSDIDNVTKTSFPFSIYSSFPSETKITVDNGSNNTCLAVVSNEEAIGKSIFTLSDSSGPDTIIPSTDFGKKYLTDGIWGSWRTMVQCPVGQYVYGYRMRSESPGGDDTALNNIELYCAASPTGSKTGIVSGGNGWGSWGYSAECGSHGPVTGFKMLIEPNIKGDDTAANDMHLFCQDNTQIEAQVRTQWGNWTSKVSCPGGKAVIGFITRVESPGGDDTALNGVRMMCGNI